jgi:hypothetical protein
MLLLKMLIHRAEMHVHDIFVAQHPLLVPTRLLIGILPGGQSLGHLPGVPVRSRMSWLYIT